MPLAPSLLPLEERREIMRRVQAVVRAIILHRTGGRRGSMRAEVEDLARECGCNPSTIARYLGWDGPLSGGAGKTR